MEDKLDVGGTFYNSVLYVQYFLTYTLSQFIVLYGHITEFFFYIELFVSIYLRLYGRNRPINIYGLHKDGFCPQGTIIICKSVQFERHDNYVFVRLARVRTPYCLMSLFPRLREEGFGRRMNGRKQWSSLTLSYMCN